MSVIDDLELRRAAYDAFSRESPGRFPNQCRLFSSGEPYIRFYAGTPITSPEGNVLGTVCVVDTQPHQLSQAQVSALEALGRRVVGMLIQARSVSEENAGARSFEETARKLQESQDLANRILSSVGDAVIVCDANGQVCQMNPVAETLTG